MPVVWDPSGLISCWISGVKSILKLGISSCQVWKLLAPELGNGNPTQSGWVLLK